MIRVEINPSHHTFDDTLREFKKKYREGVHDFALIVPTARIISQIREVLFEEFEVLYNLPILTFDDLFKKTNVEDIIIRLVIDLAVQQAIEEGQLPKTNFFQSKGFRDLAQQYISLFKNNLKTTLEIEEISSGSSLAFISIIYYYYENIKKKYQLLDRYDKYFVEEKTTNFKEVVIEGFYDFRPIEYKLLDELNQRQTQITIRIRTDVLQYQDTIQKLRALGAQIIENPYKIPNSLEIEVFSCDDKFLEIKKSAIEILKEYKKGIPFNEMAVILPDEEYSEYISYVYRESNIPIADKIPESILKYQCIRDFKSLLQAETFREFFENWSQIRLQEVSDPIFQSFVDIILQSECYSPEDFEKNADLSTLEIYEDYRNDLFEQYQAINSHALMDVLIEIFQAEIEQLEEVYQDELNEFILVLMDLKLKFDTLLKKADQKQFILDFLESYKFRCKVYKKDAVSVLTLLDARLFTYQALLFVGMTDEYYPPNIKEDYFYHSKNIKLLKTYGIEIKSKQERRKNNDKNFLIAMHCAEKKIKFLYSLEDNQKSIYLKEYEDRILNYTLKDYIKPKELISISDHMKNQEVNKVQGKSQLLHIESDKKPVYSASSLECFQTCPMKYYYRYILKLKREELPRQIVIGQVVHDTLEQYYKNVMTKDFIQNQSQPNIFGFDKIYFEQFLKYKFDRTKPEDEILYRFYRQKLIVFITEDLKELKRRGYYPTRLEDVLINKRFVHNGRSFILTGRIDRMDESSTGHFELIDYKLSKNSFRTLNDFDNNKTLQFPIYMLWENVQSCRYISIRDHESSIFMDWAKEKRSKEDYYEDVLNKITPLIERIETGDFFHRTDEVSNCKTCDYCNVCRVRVVNI